jgi:hypothetical protein
MVLGNIRLGRRVRPATPTSRVQTYVRPSYQPRPSREQAAETANLLILLVRCYADGFLASSDVLLHAGDDPELLRLLPNRSITVNSLRRFRRCHQSSLLKTLTQVLLSHAVPESLSPKKMAEAESAARERIHMAQILDVGLEDD